MVTMARIEQLDEQRSSDVIVKNPLPWVELVGSVVEVGAVVKEAPVVPENFALGNLRDTRLRVIETIEVKQMTEDNQYVVEATELNEFGFGDNLSEAIKDLQAAIAELYLTLESEQKRLGPDLAKVWSILSRKVRKADAANRA